MGDGGDHHRGGLRGGAQYGGAAPPHRRPLGGGGGGGPRRRRTAWGGAEVKRNPHGSFWPAMSAQHEVDGSQLPPPRTPGVGGDKFGARRSGGSRVRVIQFFADPLAVP